MPNWIEIFTSGVIEKLGEDSATAKELAAKLSAQAGEDITGAALWLAHSRYQDRLGLAPSLTEYCRKGKPPRASNRPLRAWEVRWKLAAKPPERRRQIRKAKRFLITSAMNECPIDERAWASMRRWAKAHDACIIVVPVRYRNPTSAAEAERQDRGGRYLWPKDLHPYLLDELHQLHPRLWLLGHVRVQATAVNPLEGLEGLSRGASGIIGHAQLAMETVPAPQHDEAKVMYTTGSVSMDYYSDTKAGVKGEFHHTTGALVVELDGRKRHPHMRPVLCDDDGGFYDFAGGQPAYYGPRGIRKCKATAGLVTGDEHVDFIDPDCVRGTYLDAGSIVKTLRPKVLVRHDVVDMFSVTHHGRNDPIKKVAAARFGFGDLRSELERGAAFVDKTTPPWARNVFPWSNHPNEHLLRYLKEVHAMRDDPVNAKIWLELWTVIDATLVPHPKGYDHADPFSWWMERRLKHPAAFLKADDSYQIEGVEVGYHGQHGPNGKRGSKINMSKLAVRTVIGHIHSPAIRHGCYVAGTSAMNMGYRKGPSSWAICHILIWPNGKRMPIFLRGRRWRL